MLLDLNKIYNEDCLIGMKKIPDKAIDLILTDPPYGINIEKMGFTTNIKGGIAKRNDYASCFEDNKISEDIFKEIFRISKHQIIFGGNYYTDFLTSTQSWIIWDKKTDDKYSNDFADCEMAWTSFKKPAKIFRYLWHGMLQHDMKNKEERYHPTQKPVKLFVLLLEKYSNVGDIILDPFMGSGTTALACLTLNRKFIGFELSETYCDIAEKRIKEHTQIMTKSVGDLI